jgi:hypothetical protein
VSRRSTQRPETSRLTTLAAAKFIESRGPNALRILDERAELAEELGHQIAAATWRDMAEAAARLLRAERDTLPIPTRMARRMPRVWLR